MSNDRAHLAAMGFPDPQIPTPEPEPEPETIADRAQAMQIPRLAGGMTDQQYADRRVARGFGWTAVDLAFRGLLAHNRWGYGYFDLVSCGTHKGHAARARKAAIEWVRVPKILRDAEAHAMTARLVALRNDLEMQRRQI
ncbi:hypothetical protein LRP88_06531 [Fusarium phalaenopsidis]